MMGHRMFGMPAAFAVLLAVVPALAGTITDATVERIAPDRLLIRWTDRDPVDVLMSDRPDASAASATRISDDDRDGRHELTVATAARPYFILRDERGGGAVRVAERLVPLEHGSNFRDIGGYPGAGGKHVRWGRIYRSGATPLLTDADVAQVRALGLADLVDLRSNEERVLAPTRIDGVRYSAIGYSMQAILANMNGGGAVTGAEAVYRGFPAQLAPQMRLLFDRLLAKDGPVAYNCSAGQDRTGFATAMILSALGVPRDVILADYHLSTGYRHPEYEMPPIDSATQARDPVAAFFARTQQGAAAGPPRPLYDAQHVSLLTYAFDEVEKRWGSVDAYLAQEAGVSAVDLAALRDAYLE